MPGNSVRGTDELQKGTIERLGVMYDCHLDLGDGVIFNRYCCLNVFPPNSHIEMVTLKVMVLGGGALGRCLSHEDGALFNRISTLIGDPIELRTYMSLHS